MKNLCDSCNYCYVTEGPGFRNITCDVGALPRNNQRPVWKCSAFRRKDELSLNEMERMAIYLEKRKDSPGFRWTRYNSDKEFCP